MAKKSPAKSLPAAAKAFNDAAAKPAEVKLDITDVLYILEGEGAQPVISGGELYRIPRGVPVVLSDSERRHLDKEGIPYTRVQGA